MTSKFYAFQQILNSLTILTLKKRNYRHYTRDKLSYKLIIQYVLYVQMSRNYRTKLRKEIKITHDKVSKNIVNRLVSCLDNRETEKQDRAPLQEAPRAYRASTEARGSSSTEDRSRSKRNDGGRRAPTTETLFLSTVVSFSRFCHHHRRLIPSSFYSPSSSLVIQLFHLASVLVIFARERNFTDYDPIDLFL